MSTVGEVLEVIKDWPVLWTAILVGALVGMSKAAMKSIGRWLVVWWSRRLFRKKYGLAGEIIDQTLFCRSKKKEKGNGCVKEKGASIEKTSAREGSDG